MNVSAFDARVYAEVVSKHTNTLTFLRQIRVRQLAELSQHRTLFSEESTTFTFPSGEPYNGEWAGAGAPGFPLDILEVDALYYQTPGTTVWEEVPGPVPINEIRLYTAPLYSVEVPITIYPPCWAWWDDKIWVPRLQSALSVKIDYWKDGTRDEKTGTKIVEASTTETNGWLNRGEVALRYAVLAEYYLMAASKDDGQASACAALSERALETLRSEARQRKGSSFVAPCAM